MCLCVGKSQYTIQYHKLLSHCCCFFCSQFSTISKNILHCTRIYQHCLCLPACCCGSSECKHHTNQPPPLTVSLAHILTHSLSAQPLALTALLACTFVCVYLCPSLARTIDFCICCCTHTHTTKKKCTLSLWHFDLLTNNFTRT